MKARIGIAAALAVLIAALACWHANQCVMAAEPNGSAQISGVWRGQMHGLPALTLNISYESGSLNGAILFYLLRKDPGKEETASAGVPEPLIAPKFDGTTLTFAVSHRRAHPQATLNSPPVHFAITIESPGKATLVRENDPSSRLEIVKDSD